MWKVCFIILSAILIGCGGMNPKEELKLSEDFLLRGKVEKALNIYLKLQHKVHGEEKEFVLYRMGVCYELMKDKNKAYDFYNQVKGKWRELAKIGIDFVNSCKYRDFDDILNMERQKHMRKVVVSKIKELEKKEEGEKGKIKQVSNETYAKKLAKMMEKHVSF